MIVDYEARKKEVLDSCLQVNTIIEELRAVAKIAELPDPSTTEAIKALLTDIQSKEAKVREGRFTLMIAGEAKSGKSTFINAYLGMELLPMDVKQCTSSLVEIKYGKKFLLRATYAGGDTEIIENKEKITEFLKINAALSDDFRDIPVPTINNELLVKAGRKSLQKGAEVSIPKKWVDDFLSADEIKAANVHNIPSYNDKTIRYIKSNLSKWKDIVTKIEIFYPFVDNLRGVEIVDSPGVCARGGVSEITEEYISEADAIIFLKPLSGQALESAEFYEFMKTSSVERNKEVLFLVLTRATNVTRSDLERLKEEAYKQFKGFPRDHIVFVDSKAELYSKEFENSTDIAQTLKDLSKTGTLEDFVKASWSDAFGDKSSFIEDLQKKSNFSQIVDALEKFGRKSHYLLMSELLKTICSLYVKICADINTQIDLFQQKGNDPKELSKKIKVLTEELEEIEFKLNGEVKNVSTRFCGDDGIVRATANSAVNDFISKADEITPESDTAFSDLEKIAEDKVRQFRELTKKLQYDVVEECNRGLISLNEGSTIPYESLKPTMTVETIKEIEDKTKSDFIKDFENKNSFGKVKSKTPIYNQNAHFAFVKNDIATRIDSIKNELISNLKAFTQKICEVYSSELRYNAENKKKELKAIEESKMESEKIDSVIESLFAIQANVSSAQGQAAKIKGGIDKNA